MSKKLSFSNFLTNYLSTLSFITFGYIFYSTNTYFQKFLYSDLTLRFSEFKVTTICNISLSDCLNSGTIYIFEYIFILYVLFLIPFYLYYTKDSKAKIVYKFLFKKIFKKDYEMKPVEKTSILAWLVKLFFAPLMVFWLSGHIFNLANNFYVTYLNRGLIDDNFLLFFNQNFFWLAFTAILFFDVLFFTLGYLLEAPFLKNEIKSVEPTFLGWFVAIICYPPFNSSYTGIFGWYSNDFPQFYNNSVHITSMEVHIFLNSLILILMGIYAWASISLGFKASNLTNRGIVTGWAYKYVRHPAYFCKNLAWWIGGLPFIIVAFGTGNWKGLYYIFLGLIAWSFMYYMRAITEERHLSADPDYIAYKKKVKYKFIPGVW